VEAVSEASVDTGDELSHESGDLLEGDIVKRLEALFGDCTTGGGRCYFPLTA
jgi:hypothetical protein